MKSTNKSLASWVTWLYLLLMITFFPLFCGTQGYQHISQAKYGAFLALCGGYVILMAILGLEGLLIGTVKLPSPRKLWESSSWAQRLIVLYLLLT